jgi:hypothetical protein
MSKALSCSIRQLKGPCVIDVHKHLSSCDRVTISTSGSRPRLISKSLTSRMRRHINNSMAQLTPLFKWQTRRLAGALTPAKSANSDVAGAYPRDMVRAQMTVGATSLARTHSILKSLKQRGIGRFGYHSESEREPIKSVASGAS